MPVDPHQEANAAANQRGAEANAAAEQRKRELMAQGMSEAEAHQSAMKVYQEYADKGAPPSATAPAAGPQAPAAPPPTVGFQNTTDPRKAAANQRALIQNRGDILGQQDQDRLASEERRRNYYSDYNDPLYRADAEGLGGYNDQERTDILGREGLDRLQLSDSEARANYLTPDEAAAMRGDPASYARYFNPDQMDQSLRVDQGRQDQAVNDYDQNLRKSIDAGALKQSDTYRQNSRNILNQNRGGFEGAFGATAGNVRGAIDPSAVTTSDQFLQDYNMSPEERQDIVTGAGISAGTGYRAAAGELQRRGAAAGASPLAIGAYRARMEREGAAAAGDAMTQARIKASEAAAGRKISGEELRQQGGRYLTDVRTGTEMGLGQEALRGQEALGEQARQQENLMETNRQGAQQFLTQADMDAARAAGTARIQNAQNVTGVGQGAREFAATTGTGIATAQDRDLAARNAAIAQNRQAAEQYNQDARYGRGMAANTALSNRAAGVGDTRLNQQNLARNYYTGQSGQANANAEAARQRQLGAYATQTSGTNQATAIGEQAASRPALWEKIANTALGAVGAATGAGFIPKPKPKSGGAMAEGGVVSSPTVALLGEEGPEMVTPLTYRARAKIRPSATMSQEVVKPPRRFYGEAA